MANVGALVWKLQADVADLVTNCSAASGGFQRVSSSADQASASMLRFAGMGANFGPRMTQEAAAAQAAANAMGVYAGTAGKVAGATAAWVGETARLGGVSRATLAAMGPYAGTAAKVADATTAAATSTNIFGNALRGMAGTLGLTFGASGVIMAARSALQYADNLGEMSTAANVSVEALQELGYAAQQNGSDLQGMVNTLQIMSERLGSGDASAAASVERLGLSLQSIKAASPDVAFRQIAAGLKTMEDGNVRNAAAADLFGKSWKSIMATALADIDRLSAEAPKMSQAQVDSLGNANDAWDKFALNVKVRTGEIIANYLRMRAAMKAKLGASESDDTDPMGVIPITLPPTNAPAGWGGKTGGRTDAELKAIEKELTIAAERAMWVNKSLDEMREEFQRLGAIGPTVLDAINERGQKLLDWSEKAAAAVQSLQNWKDSGLQDALIRTGLAEAPDARTEAENRAKAERDAALKKLQEDIQAAGPANPMTEAEIEQRRYLIELEYQQKLRKAYDEWMASVQAAAEATDKMTASVKGLSASVNAVSGGGNGAGRPGGPGGSLIPGMKLSPQMADALMYGATLDTIGMGNTPLRDSYIATKLADKDMTGLGQSGFTVNVNQTMPFNNDPASLASMQALIQQAILDALKRQGMA